MSRPTELVRLHSRPWPLPAKLIARPLVAAGAITFYFANSLVSAEGGLAFAAGMFLFLLVLFVPALLGGVVVRVLRTRLVLDEGGMRLVLGGSRTHWPYALLGSAEVRLASLGTDALVVSDRTGRPVVELPVLNESSAESAREVARRFAKGRERAEEWNRPTNDELARRGRSIEEWCSALDALARAPEDPGFRERFVDRSELAEILCASGAPPEERAAAAYVLLNSAESHRTAALTRIGGASPPLVLLMAERASGGQLEVSADALEEARDYLDDDDRRALSRR